MADVFPKFIIEDGNLIIAKCTYARTLKYDTGTEIIDLP